MIPFLFSISVIFSQASGVISLKGVIEKPCETFTCKIKVNSQIYQIDLTRLSKKQQQLFNSKKAGDEVSEAIPMSAIKDVKDVK